MPRRTGSSDSMISIARTLGAPGHRARWPAGAQQVGHRRVVTQTWHGWSTPAATRWGGPRPRTSPSTFTLPTCATRPRSLRIRSTIIRFSARSLMLVCTGLVVVAAGHARGSASRGQRALDRACTSPHPFSSFKKRSGETLAIGKTHHPGGRQKTAPGCGRVSALVERERHRPRTHPSSRCDRLASDRCRRRR